MPLYGYFAGAQICGYRVVEHPLTISPMTSRSRAVSESRPAAQLFTLHPLLALRTVTFQDKKTVRDLQTTPFHQN
jgi:hypothetical protein